MLYFAYGMNTNTQGMAHRCPGAVAFGCATLEGHRFRFAGPADVQRDRHSDVDGVLWDITEECLASLDVLEGYPFYYDRKWARVWFERGKRGTPFSLICQGPTRRCPADG